MDSMKIQKLQAQVSRPNAVADNCNALVHNPFAWDSKADEKK
jgi:hypothetical protein